MLRRLLALQLQLHLVMRPQGAEEETAFSLADSSSDVQRALDEAERERRAHEGAERVAAGAREAKHETVAAREAERVAIAPLLGMGSRGAQACRRPVQQHSYLVVHAGR